jgi:pSer/pThr/pTyr-binding forkhead associated (FHA) protein
MTAAPIPNYPVIYVDVRADGSAHVNVAGRHIDYPAGPLADTRAAVTRYAVDMALTLGRAVRINTTEPAGTFRMAAHPDGTLTDLAAVEGKPKRRRRAQPHQGQAQEAALPTGATAVIHPPVETVTPPSAEATASADAPDVELKEAKPAPPRAAVLTFSSGEAATVAGSALIGRHPTPLQDEVIDELITIDDTTRTVSKTHFRVEWHADLFWIADRDAANGIILQRHGAASITLTAWQPHELQHGDVLFIGDVTVTVTIANRTQAEVRS